jgi:hypothetical protein
MKNVFAYRVFDLRDRFEMPFPNALAALRALYSEGRRSVIPNKFFIQRKPRFSDKNESKKWLIDRQVIIARNNGVGIAEGLLIANPHDRFDKQLNDAMSSFGIA